MESRFMGEVAHAAIGLNGKDADDIIKNSVEI
jgi:hypothetical protein